MLIAAQACSLRPPEMGSEPRTEDVLDKADGNKPVRLGYDLDSFKMRT